MTQVVEPALGFVLQHALENSGFVDEELRHEPGRMVRIPCKAEPLGAFVADDMQDASGVPT